MRERASDFLYISGHRGMPRISGQKQKNTLISPHNIAEKVSWNRQQLSQVEKKTNGRRKDMSALLCA